MLDNAAFMAGEQVHGEIETFSLAHVVQWFRQGVRNKLGLMKASDPSSG